MTDTTLLKMTSETATLLKKVPVGFDAPAVLPSYNACLEAAKENHPEDAFIANLTPVKQIDSPLELAILFTQLRIVLESIVGVSDTID